MVLLDSGVIGDEADKEGAENAVITDAVSCRIETGGQGCRVSPEHCPLQGALAGLVLKSWTRRVSKE